MEQDYKELEKQCYEFLKVFRHREEDEDIPRFKYLERIQKIVDRESKILEIEVDDVASWGAVENGADAGFSLAMEMMQNTKRFVDMFSSAADTIIAEREPTNPSLPRDTIDILNEQRLAREQANREETAQEEGIYNMEMNPSTPAGPGVDPSIMIPPALTRRYEVRILPPSGDKAIALREVRAEHIGHLVKVTGVVTRVTEVKPRAAVVCYACGSCGDEVYQPINKRDFMPLFTCPNTTHQEDGRPQSLHMEIRHSKFVKYQELKLQEPADQVPVGHIPRTMTVLISGELTRQCTAGDVVIISGVFLPTPITGWRGIKSRFLSETHLEAMSIDQQKKSYKDFVMTPAMEARVAEVTMGEAVYDNLARSIAPEIFGHEDVKKALLLLLVGAPSRKLEDGMRMRGDLHVCLMGDPGVAKSQLLKYIAKVSPRGVYTTGKGSSGVGLTAAVMRDTTTGEMTLEGGALILADNGIACIDEFDKMNEIDRTAIHEVMEQQTISIAKAGVTTTLNARASVLAAANPAYGRYRRDRSPAENINLPAALLSRFDLLFLLLDRAHPEADLALARHVTHVHRTGENPPLGFDPIEPQVLRAYIAEARSRNDPLLPSDGSLDDYIVSNYVAMRANEASAPTKSAGYTTARTLLSVLRLAQALARVRFSDIVEAGDVDEAMRLIRASSSSLHDNDDEEDNLRNEDAITALYRIIRQHKASMSQDDAGLITFAEIEPIVVNRGFSRDQMMECFEEYDSLGVWKLDRAQQTIQLIM